jgi:hypothetical protein
VSTTLYITPENKVPGLETNNDRCALAQVLQDLTPVAQQLGLTPLERFQSYADADLPEPMGDDTPPEYFDPVAALLTIETLAANLPKLTFAQTGRRPRPIESILKDLDDCRKVLVALKNANTRFRFHLGF